MNPFGAVVILVGLVALVVGAFWALVTYVGLQASLIWTAGVGGIAWLIRTDIEKKRELAKLHAEQKRSQYLEFLQFMAAYFVSSSAKSSDAAAPPSVEKLAQWNLRLIVIGSDDVVRAWNAVRLFPYTAVQDDAPEEEKRKHMVAMMRLWGVLLMAMRRDCGHPGTKLKMGDLFSTFVNDLEKYPALLEDEAVAGKPPKPASN